MPVGFECSSHYARYTQVCRMKASPNMAYRIVRGYCTARMMSILVVNELLENNVYMIFVCVRYSTVQIVFIIIY